MARRDKIRKLQQQLRFARQSPSSQPPPVNPPGEIAPRQVVERLVQMSMRAEGFTGPLPPPEMLEHYNRLVPGFAERFMVMAEKQADHRRELEATVITRRSRNESWGLHYAAILAVLFGGGSFYLIAQGHSTAGIVTIIAEITALAGAFIVGRLVQRKENKEKLAAVIGRISPQ